MGRHRAGEVVSQSLTVNSPCLCPEHLSLPRQLQLCPWWGVSKGPKKQPASPLYSTSSSFFSQNKRGKSYKKDRTTLPWEMFSSFCLALYTMLASRDKSNILVINVTIKLLHREIWRFIFSLYMKKSDIIAINVIIKLPQMGIWRLIFSQYMKKSNILAINVIIKLQETSIAIRERERGTGVLTLYYFYSSPDTIQCSLSLSLCETTALSQWERTHHLKSDPEGIRYPCSSCEYKSRNKGKLNSHIQVKHKGGRRSPAVSVNTRPASLKKYSHRSSKLFQGRLSPPLD